mmetsp:Transcript_49780/g.121523  ORF Transcript_49780/g.121523 Transcript_49780/m.121523 type:complete len:110 (-) Transcript_49780:141-470(-)
MMGPGEPRRVQRMGRSMGSVALSGQELLDAFSAMDLRSRGSITPSELQELLRRFGMPITDDEAQEMVRIGDTNGDGMLDISDFWSMMQQAPEALPACRQAPDSPPKVSL